MASDASGSRYLYVLSRNKVGPLNFCNFLYVPRTIIIELFGSQEGVLRY